MSGWRNTTRLGSSAGVEAAGVSTTAGSSVTSGAISAGSSPLSDSTTTGGSNGFSTGLSVFLTTFFAAGFTVSAGTSAVASATWTRVSDTGALAETGLLETAASSFFWTGTTAAATFSFLSIRVRLLRSGCSGASGATSSTEASTGVAGAATFVLASVFAPFGAAAFVFLALVCLSAFFASFSFSFSAWMPAYEMACSSRILYTSSSFLRELTFLIPNSSAILCNSGRSFSFSSRMLYFCIMRSE